MISFFKKLINRIEKSLINLFLKEGDANKNVKNNKGAYHMFQRH